MHLEFRLGGEFDGMVEPRHRSMWCDGLWPDAYELSGDPRGAKEQRPRICGDAWICYRQDQYLWRFTLLLPAEEWERWGSREAIVWEALLPRHDVTCWISFDEEKRELEIEPGVARPDLM